MNKPIYGHVPGALPPPALPNALRLEESEPEQSEKTKRDDWARGYPRGTKRADVIAGTAVPLDPPPRVQVKRKPGRPPGSPNKPSAPPPPAPNACTGCNKPLSPLSLDMVGELLRMARDRLAEAGGDGRTDLLFLAARIDGCCSVSCWAHNVAPEQLVAALFADRR